MRWLNLSVLLLKPVSSRPLPQFGFIFWKSNKISGMLWQTSPSFVPTKDLNVIIEAGLF